VGAELAVDEAAQASQAVGAVGLGSEAVAQAGDGVLALGHGQGQEGGQGVGVGRGHVKAPEGLG